MIVVSYGGGTNSTALIVEAILRGIKPDLILFADTGSEMPHTYKFIDVFQEWLARFDLSIEIVRWLRKDNSFVKLHEYCEEAKELPSKAYGNAGCTSKWKQHPIEKRVKQLSGVVERWIGYDADEKRRVDRMKDVQRSSRFIWRSPLYEWGIDRDQCVEIIHKVGLPQPLKSSCFMCPSMRKGEILDLAATYPELARQAIGIEDGARRFLTSIKGLGRSYAWRDFLEGKEEALQAREIVSPNCGCHDDSDDRD